MHGVTFGHRHVIWFSFVPPSDMAMGQMYLWDFAGVWCYWLYAGRVPGCGLAT